MKSMSSRSSTLLARGLIVLVPALLASSAAAQVYVDTTRTEPWVPIASVPGIQDLRTVSFNNADNGSVSITPLPFAFNFFGVDYTRVNLASNGFLTFGTEAATLATNPIPGASTSAPNTWIAPLWDDLVHPAVANARWGVVGTAPNRVVVLEAGPASRRTATTGTVYYQIWLYEGLEGRFEYRATGDPAFALDATIGYEGAAGRRGVNAAACAPANVCTAVPVDTTFVSQRARPPELSGTLTVPARGARPGVPVDATVNLRNLGVDTATGVLVSVYLSTNNTLDAADTIVGTAGPIDVDARTVGTTTTARIVVPAGLADGDYVVILEVDSGDDWTEVDEVDNITALTPRFATAYELRPSSIAFRNPLPVNAGDNLGLTVAVQNDAIPVIGPVSAQLYLSVDRVQSADDVVLGPLTITLSGVDPQNVLIDVPMPVLPIGGYYPIVVIDADNTFPELLENNGTLIGSTRVFVGPDFTIASVTVPAQAAPGSQASIRTRVDSTGAAYTGPVTYQLFASLDTLYDTGDALLGEYTLAWAGDDFRDDTRLVTWPTTPGRYYVVARVDPAAVLTEIDEANNTRASGSTVINASDFSVSALTFTPAVVSAGGTATVTATLRSLGLTYPGRLPYAVHLSRDSTLDAGDVLLTTSSVALGAATTLARVIRVQIPAGTLPGPYRLLATVDPQDVIPELLETNNTFAGATRLTVPGAELQVVSVTGTSTAVVGQPYRVELVVHNGGAVDARDFSYAYYVSSNPLIRLTDTRVLTSATTSIAAGATRTFVDEVLLSAMTTTTTVYLGAIVDVTGVVPEVSEVDNVGRVPSPITLTVPRPNVVARALRLEARGRELTLVRTVANTGAAQAQVTGTYYLSTNEAISVADLALSPTFRVVLEPGAVGTSTDVVVVPPSVAAGRYTVGYLLDPGALVEETREDDNSAAAGPLELVDEALTVVTAQLPVGRVGVPYRATLGARGGLTYTWSTREALPDGLVLDAATGVISGTPTSAGSTPVTVEVSSGGARGERALMLTVVATPAPLAVLTAALPRATSGAPYTATLEAVGGVPPLVWSLEAPAAGLVLDAQGVLSGMITESTRVRVVVRDVLGARATRALSVLVRPSSGLIVEPRALPEATVGVDYCASGPVQLYARGGQAPYTWTVQGVAPAGLTLSSSGLLCGTPTASGESTLDVETRDAAGGRVVTPYVVVVRAAEGLRLTTTGLPDGVVGDAYTGVLAATGGRAPYTYAVLAPWVPGLELSMAGQLTGTPTLEGVFEGQVLVSDADGSADVRALFVAVTRPAPPSASPTPSPSPTITPVPMPTPEPEGGCSCSTRGEGGPSSLAGLVALLWLVGRRRRQI